MKPFALWSPHVAASYDTQFFHLMQLQSRLKLKFPAFFILGIGLDQNLAVALALAISY
jgi:hypothetical protein